MSKLPIKLGQSSEMNSKPCPVGQCYPTLHLDWDDSIELPESGELTVRFNKVSETHSKLGSKSRQSVVLEILSIEEIEESELEEDEGDEDEESSGDRIDKMAKEAEEEESD